MTKKYKPDPKMETIELLVNKRDALQALNDKLVEALEATQHKHPIMLDHNARRCPHCRKQMEIALLVSDALEAAKDER